MTVVEEESGRGGRGRNTWKEYVSDDMGKMQLRSEDAQSGGV
jgi:hypothetical protein